MSFGQNGVQDFGGFTPHRALGGLAPLEYLARVQAESVPQRVSDALADYNLQGKYSKGVVLPQPPH